MWIPIAISSVVCTYISIENYTNNLIIIEKKKKQNKTEREKEKH